MADTQTPYYNLVKPEIGGSIDTWGVKLNANADILDLTLNGLAMLDGTKPFSAEQEFDSIRIGTFVISFDSGGTEALLITEDVNGLIATLEIDGTFTAKEVVADPSLA